MKKGKSSEKTLASRKALLMTQSKNREGACCIAVVIKFQA